MKKFFFTLGMLACLALVACSSPESDAKKYVDLMKEGKFTEAQEIAAKYEDASKEEQRVFEKAVIKETGKAIQEGIEEAGEAIKDASNDAAKALEEASEDAAKALEQASEDAAKALEEGMNNLFK